jgi:hypothetical protein
MPGQIFHISEEPNFTDEELEELQNLLWRGYQPEPYRRHDLDLYSPLDRPIWHWHVSPKELKAAEAERAERYAEQERQLDEWRTGVRAGRTGVEKYRTVEQWSEFRCDNCRRKFRSVSDEAEIDADYRETFGENATQERLAVCEKCYDLLMKGYTT